MWRVVFSKQAAKDAKRLKSSGLAGKAKDLVTIVREDPFMNPPSYEALVGNLSGLYSRRINILHRFVYEVVEGPVDVDGVAYQGTVKVLRMWTHYDGL